MKGIHKATKCVSTVLYAMHNAYVAANFSLTKKYCLQLQCKTGNSFTTVLQFTSVSKTNDIVGLVMSSNLFRVSYSFFEWRFLSCIKNWGQSAFPSFYFDYKWSRNFWRNFLFLSKNQNLTTNHLSPEKGCIKKFLPRPELFKS